MSRAAVSRAITMASSVGMTRTLTRDPGDEITGALAAFAFSRFRFKGRRGGLLALLLIQMFPQFLAAVALYLMFTDIGDVVPAIGLDTLPVRIECFDISHLGGTHTTASMVVFEGGAPKKSDYRRFNIREVDPGDDYAAMAEVLTRRHGQWEKQAERSPYDAERDPSFGALPNLIVIDGGKGQLAAGLEPLQGFRRRGAAVVSLVTLVPLGVNLLLTTDTMVAQLASFDARRSAVAASWTPFGWAWGLPFDVATGRWATRKYASAMCPAVCSWRVEMVRMASVRS